MVRLSSIVFVSVLVLVILASGSCAAGQDRAPEVSRAPASTAVAAGQARADSPSEAIVKGEPQNSAVGPRKLVRNGELHLTVKVYEPAREQLERAVRQAGGYVAKSEVRHARGQVSSAHLVLRIPAALFEGLVALLSRLGTTERESNGSEDITETYYDLAARLSNAKKLEARYLELLQVKASTVADLLKVEQELARVRETIERFEGKLRLYDDLVALSTLTVELYIENLYTPPREPTLGEDAGDVLSSSWHALRAFGRALLLLAVALLPWLIPIGLATWLTVRLIARLGVRRRSRLAAQRARGQSTPVG